MEHAGHGEHVGHDHSGHNHSDHQNMPMTAVPGMALHELRRPEHGSYEGHVLPGSMFIALSAYWMYSVFHAHLVTRMAVASRKPGRTARGGSAFQGSAWYPWPLWPGPQLEPLCKVALPVFGVLIELWIGWGWTRRPLFADDGHFAMFHINNWQHALMYGAFAISGVVDLLGYYGGDLPPGLEQCFLCAAFLCETLLMGLHAKHNPLDQAVHSMLTALMCTCVLVTAAEVAAPHSFLLAALRPLAVMLQGTWFIQIGVILYRGHMEWDMDDMSSLMFLPVIFCLHILVVATSFLTVYLGMRWLYARYPHLAAVGHQPGTPATTACVVPHALLGAGKLAPKSSSDGGVGGISTTVELSMAQDVENMGDSASGACGRRPARHARGEQCEEDERCVLIPGK